MTQRAVFFDRDGVLNDTVDRGEDFFVHNKKVRYTAPYFFHEFRPKENILKIMEAVKRAGFLRILATNQPDITYGTMPAQDHGKIMAVVKTWPLDDIFVCTHGRNDNCDCKKPKPGMLLAAAGKWGIDLSKSFMVGDTASDAEAAKAAGCTSVLVLNGRNTGVAADLYVPDLASITSVIGITGT